MAWYEVKAGGKTYQVCSTDDDPKEIARGYAARTSCGRFEAVVDGKTYVFKLKSVKSGEVE